MLRRSYGNISWFWQRQGNKNEPPGTGNTGWLSITKTPRSVGGNHEYDNIRTRTVQTHVQRCPRPSRTAGPPEPPRGPARAALLCRGAGQRRPGAADG